MDSLARAQSNASRRSVLGRRFGAGALCIMLVWQCGNLGRTWTASTLPSLTTMTAFGRASVRLSRRTLALRAAGVNPFAMVRTDVKSTLFSCLDQDGDRRLNRAEMKKFAEMTGFEGTDADWAGEFEVLCEPQGCDFAAFSRLIDDDSDDGLYCEDAELADMLNQLLMSGVGIPAGRAPAKAALGEAVPAGLEYFVREREAGLYDGEWKAWDPDEGIKARTPRVGKIGTLDGCPSTADVQEALMFVNEQVQEGIFGDASTQAQERLGELLALQGSAAKGAGWFEFRLDENVMDEEQLSEMVLAPRGWQVDRSTIPTGYMMHIMSVGNGVEATLCGREGLHIVNSLHRDVSKCKRLCDTGLCGVVGRKRVIVFPPDAFPSSTTVLRSPDMTCDMLRPLCDMPEEEAWSRLEEMAQQPGSKGGVVDLEPGMFFFIPHGWWHAVRPIDDFTFITGPSQLSGLGVATV